MQLLIIIFIIIVGLLFYSYQQNKENFEPIFQNNIADAYYWPTNCMDTILSGVKCFPFFSYWPTYSYPYYYN